MYFRVIGNHLVEEGVLTKQQLDSMMQYRLKNRVKLGVLAVEEKMMSPEQADEVNRLQAQMDKRFGDIAVEKGYLTDGDVGKLISKQGNPYILFLQGVLEMGYMGKEELLLHMEHFRVKNSLTEEQMTTILDGSADDVASILLKCDDKHADGIFKLAVRNIVRFISTDIWFNHIERTDIYEADHLAYQTITGDADLMIGFDCENDELLTIASTYAREEFTELDADSYDSVCEFINCTNGLYTRSYSVEGRELELNPPSFKEKTVLNGIIYVLPVKVNNKPITIVIKLN